MVAPMYHKFLPHFELFNESIYIISSFINKKACHVNLPTRSQMQ